MLRSHKLSAWSLITTKFSKPKSLPLLKNYRIGNKPDKSILKTFKLKPWSFMKASLKKYRASTKSQRPKVPILTYRVTNASILPAHSPALLSPGPTITSPLTCYQSLQRNQRKKEEHLVYRAGELQPADSLDKRHLQAQRFFKEH